MSNKKTGVELIAEERKRQIDVEGWGKGHDACHDQNELALAAICYAFPQNNIQIGDEDGRVNPLVVMIERIRFWPWGMKWWKPSPKNRVRELVKAGALIAAEIDRLQNR